MKVERHLVRDTPLLSICDSSLPIVRFAFALRQGVASDPKGRAGLTHITLELLLRGTEAKDRQTFNQQLEKMGSQLHVTVGQQMTLLRGAALKRHLRATLALVAEAMITPALNPDELAPLCNEVIESLRADRDDDETLVDLFLRRALYADHPFARNPHGEVKDVRAITIEKVRAHHQRQMADLIIGVAGDLGGEEAARAVEPILTGLERICEKRAAALAPPAASRGLRILVADKPKRKQVQLRLARLAIEGTHADVLPFWLGVTAFGGTFTAPLCREVRDKRGWSYVAQADFDRRSTLASPVILRTAPALCDALHCLMLEIDLYRDLARGEIEDQAVDFARSYLCNRDPLERASATQLLSAALKNEALGLATENLFTTPARLEALPTAEVTAAMSRHLDPNSMTVVMVADASDVVEKLRDRCNAQIEIADYRDGLDLDA